MLSHPPLTRCIGNIHGVLASLKRHLNNSYLSISLAYKLQSAFIIASQPAGALPLGTLPKHICQPNCVTIYCSSCVGACCCWIKALPSCPISSYTPGYPVSQRPLSTHSLALINYILSTHTHTHTHCPHTHTPPPHTHTQYNLANERALEADRACVSMETTNTQQQLHISQLDLELSKFKGHETEADSLRDHIMDMEEQLARLHTEVSHMTVMWFLYNFMVLAYLVLKLLH